MLLKSYFDTLQVFGSGTVAVEQFITSGVSVDSVGLRVEELEGLSRERDLNVGGLPDLDGYSLEPAEGLQRAFAICEVADVKLYNLTAVSTTCIGDRYGKICT